MNSELPEVIRDVGFDFSWDEKKVWALPLPVDDMKIEDLTWHLLTPFIWSKPNGYYDVKPIDVIKHPAKYPEEHERVKRANVSYPIDIMFWKGRWVILDGLHRLMKQYMEGHKVVRVRKVPSSAISIIRTS